MKKIIVFGATSAIAQETAKIFSSRKDALFLVGRNADLLQTIADDLKVRGASDVVTATEDLNAYEKHALLFSQALERLGEIDGVLIAHGTLGDQKQCEANFELAKKEYDTNFLSVVSLLTPIANYFEQKKSGFIAVISSVAGDRGRQSNYIYGSAKAAVSTFLQGLRQRLSKSNVQVLTIKPGFVDTPMTANVPKNALFAQPAAVAQNIVKAIDKEKDVVYLPWFWRGIMTAIKMIPERIFKKLSL